MDHAGEVKSTTLSNHGILKTSACRSAARYIDTFRGRTLSVEHLHVAGGAALWARLLGRHHLRALVPRHYGA